MSSNNVIAKQFNDDDDDLEREPAIGQVIPESAAAPAQYQGDEAQTLNPLGDGAAADGPAADEIAVIDGLGHPPSEAAPNNTATLSPPGDGAGRESKCAD